MRRVYIASSLLTFGLLGYLAAGPASQPDASAYPALQKMLATLRAENEYLKAENKSLLLQVADLKRKVPATGSQPPAEQRKFQVGDELEIGMTLEQVKQATGDANPELQGKDAMSTVYIFKKKTEAFATFNRWNCVFDATGEKLLSFSKSLAPDAGIGFQR